MNEIQQVLHKIEALKDVPEPYVLKQLVGILRVTGNDLKAQQTTNKKINDFITELKQHPNYAKGLTTYILTLFDTYHRISLFSDTGISNYGFSYNLFRLMGHRFIPLLPDENDIIELIDYLFDNRYDEYWLASIDSNLWLDLISILSRHTEPTDLLNTARNNILNAMEIVSYRINGLGLHQDLMRAYPEMLGFSAAFIAQNKETLLFTSLYRNAHKIGDYQEQVFDSAAYKAYDAFAPFEVMAADTAHVTDLSTAPILVMLEQCDNTVSTIRKRIYKTGISIRLTNMLLRLEQSIERLRNLSELLSNDPKTRDKAIVELTKAVITSAKRRYSISHLISTNTELLSRKVTENAGRVGEHYISTDKSGYKKMFKKAAIGGFVIAFMATIKILSYDLDLAPMGRAFVNSMIYGLGFVSIHIIHGTVATKQPAMTAAAIASTISVGSGKKSHQLAKLSELMVDILRTQFIAIMGNVLIALPLALVISFAWLQFSGTAMIDFDKADHLIADLNPITSLALFHAAIAGVFLFLAGLIAGFYDNLAVFNRIGERIARHKLLLKVLSANKTARLGRFVESNLGAIMGNFMFGVFLGSTATLGYIFGLPLDIRHIAFSSANFAHGFFNINVDHFSFSLVFISLLGVALIGIINLLVSFSLALIVALRSKGVKFYEWKTLGKLVWTHLMTHTRDFFWPRPEPMQYTYIDHYGQIIHEDVDKKTANTKVISKAKKEGKHAHERRVSDIRVTPDGVGIDSDRVSKAQEKKTLNQKLKDPNATEVTSRTVKKEVVLNDDSLNDDVKNNMVIDDDLGVSQISKGSANDAAKSSTQDTVHSTDRSSQNLAKTSPLDKESLKDSLPKPKNPPNLPD